MKESRRAFLKSAGTILVVGGAMQRVLDAAGFDPLEKNIRELQRAMAAGQLTSARLVSFYLDRIAAYDQLGPRVNAVIAVNPHAGRYARELDEERRKKGPRGPLHGIPVLLKDNFDTNDMATTGGCLALSSHQPKDDAFQVRRLRDAGAVILGKVNLHELALGLTTVSSIGGQTLDPYDLTRAPGGSSGGSAVAATMNFAAATLGTDTAGSIRIPSCHNNVVGLRPTIGLSSRAGIIPFSRTQDVGGPIARTVEDIAVLLDATAGYDANDPVTANGNGKIPRLYTSSLKRHALKGARIGVLTEYFGGAPEDVEVAVVVKRAIDEMKAHGATTVDVAIPNLAAMIAASNVLPAGDQGVARRLPEDVRRAGRVGRGAARVWTARRAASRHTRHREPNTRRLLRERRTPAPSRGARDTGAGGPQGHGRQPRRRARVSGREKNRARDRRQSTRQQRSAVAADGIPGDERPGRIHARRIPRRHGVARPSVRRGDADRDRVLVRTGDAPSPGSRQSMGGPLRRRRRAQALRPSK